MFLRKTNRQMDGTRGKKDPVTPLLGIYPKKPQMLLRRDMCVHVFTAVLVTVAPGRPPPAEGGVVRIHLAQPDKGARSRRPRQLGRPDRQGPVPGGVRRTEKANAV